ncbi:hypothetical protein K4H02_26655, partial [Mycobacterium tuberculosis]|nr:hypothetical protein [Mycobacterium tuberculosis]
DYFGGDEHPYFTAVAGDAIQYKTIPCRTINLANGQTAKVVTVFDLMVANLAECLSVFAANLIHKLRRSQLCWKECGNILRG